MRHMKDGFRKKKNRKLLQTESKKQMKRKHNSLSTQKENLNYRTRLCKKKIHNYNKGKRSLKMNLNQLNPYFQKQIKGLLLP